MTFKNQEHSTEMAILNKIKGPFMDIVEYTKYSLKKIEDLPIYINIDDKLSTSKKLQEKLFDFIKVSYEIQQGYSEKLQNEKFMCKGDERDVVTEADIMIEKRFREEFSSLIPNYTIAGEEDKIDIHDKSKMILLDPIDGTSWFINGEAKYGTVLGIYRNGYNIMSVVLNTKKGVIYFSDLNGFETYSIKKEDEKIAINKEEIIDETQKDNIYLHLNFKGEDKEKNEEIRDRLTNGLERFNQENNTAYRLIFMQTSSDTGVRVGRKEVGGFIHYGPAPHDIAGNLIYSIHNPDLNFTNHTGEKYNYFDHDDLIKSYLEYDDKKESDGKKFLYKYPMVMTNNKKLHNFILDILDNYKDIFNKKAQITN